MEYILTAESLGKQYGHFKALDGSPSTCRRALFTDLQERTEPERLHSSASCADFRSPRPAVIHCMIQRTLTPASRNAAGEWALW